MRKKANFVPKKGRKEEKSQENGIFLVFFLKNIRKCLEDFGNMSIFAPKM